MDDSLNITLHGAESLDKIATVLSSLATLGSGITAAAQSDATLTPNQKLHIQNLAKELPERLLALMVVDQLVTQMPKFAVVLALLGLLDITTHPGDLTDPISSAYIERAIRLDRLKLLITHPLEHFQALYSFGLPTFDGLDLFLRLKTILDNRYEQARIITEVGQPNVLQAPSFVLAVDQTTNPPGLVYPLRFGVTGATSVEFVNGDWVLKLQRDGQFGSGAMLKLSPSSQISIVPSWGTATLSFSISLTADRSVNPFTL